MAERRFPFTIASNNGGASGGVDIADSLAWSSLSLNLNAFVGQTIQIRFDFDTGDNILNDFLGWQVDDVALSASAGVGNLFLNMPVVTTAGDPTKVIVPRSIRPPGCRSRTTSERSTSARPIRSRSRSPSCRRITRSPRR